MLAVSISPARCSSSAAGWRVSQVPAQGVSCQGEMVPRCAHGPQAQQYCHLWRRRRCRSLEVLRLWHLGVQGGGGRRSAAGGGRLGCGKCIGPWHPVDHEYKGAARGRAGPSPRGVRQLGYLLFRQQLVQTRRPSSCDGASARSTFCCACGTS